MKTYEQLIQYFNNDIKGSDRGVDFKMDMAEVVGDSMPLLSVVVEASELPSEDQVNELIKVFITGYTKLATELPDKDGEKQNFPIKGISNRFEHQTCLKGALEPHGQVDVYLGVFDTETKQAGKGKTATTLIVTTMKDKAGFTAEKMRAVPPGHPLLNNSKQDIEDKLTLSIHAAGLGIVKRKYSADTNPIAALLGMLTAAGVSPEVLQDVNAHAHGAGDLGSVTGRRPIPPIDDPANN